MGTWDLARPMSTEIGTHDLTRVIEWMILNVEHHPTLMADASKTSRSTGLGFLTPWRITYGIIRSWAAARISQPIMIWVTIFKTFWITSMAILRRIFPAQHAVVV